MTIRGESRRGNPQGHSFFTVSLLPPQPAAPKTVQPQYLSNAATPGNDAVSHPPSLALPLMAPPLLNTSPSPTRPTLPLPQETTTSPPTNYQPSHVVRQLHIFVAYRNLHVRLARNSAAPPMEECRPRMQHRPAHRVCDAGWSSVLIQATSLHILLKIHKKILEPR
ncbi:hypothetical protein E2C01_100895 [Portunus trituberculatus]|uniref:Uncharacterized protein n=1 Tax=Portunus trituberculatus TaxID=210409 RepID=A0A5B7KEH5_PORTR|nr:hypothetical protein [Portunus trituberculatus]